MTGEAMTIRTVLEELITRKETCYDPEIIDAFIRVLGGKTNPEEIII